MVCTITKKANLKILTCKGMVLVDVSSIIRIEAISNYSKIFFTNGKTLVVAKVLRWFEEILEDNRFLRIHRTHIVNRSFIKDYTHGTVRSSSGGKVYLSNGESFVVSKRKKTLFLKRWYQHAA